MVPRCRRRTLAALLVVGVVVFLSRAAWSQTGDQDVLTVIPENYTLLFENAFVRVIEARVPPDGQWVRSDRRLGTVYWSESSLHILRNVGKTTSHTIRVELKY